MSFFRRIWEWLKANVKPAGNPTLPAPHPAPATPQPVKAPVVLEPEWLTIARKEIGVTELRGRENPRIIEYHAATSLKAKEDEVPWCSSFANWCLKQAGIAGTNSAWARDWLKWGEELTAPQMGCICVIERNAPGGDSHVFFWVGEEGDYVLALGGNQSDSVSVARYRKSLVLGYRWPKQPTGLGVKPRSGPIAPLSWEKNHPERVDWSKHLWGLVRVKYFDVLRRAEDIDRLRPDFHVLTDDQKATVICEMFSAMAFHESSWNPGSVAVDVGRPDNRDTWSVGLLQMSVVDQRNYGIDFGYSYDDILKPLPNLTLGVAIMAQQIQRKGKIVLSSGVYWAVLKDGGKYQCIPEISNRMRQIFFD